MESGGKKRFRQLVPLLTASFVDLASSSYESRNSWSPESRNSWNSENRKLTAQERSPVQGKGYYYGQQPLVHTFETQASCMRRCTLSCVVQNVEDLMMPRWICPQQSSELSSHPTSTESTDYFAAFDNQLLLLLVPLILILLIALVILLMRRTSHNEDELV
ncbi:hypothetical protein FO519_009022 [Halicephalobus sp. NKZ332]|nr:hypothetical protein FO519_009022 [Halicephalobus sp. NKZ332]